MINYMYKVTVYWCRMSMDTEHLPVFFLYRKNKACIYELVYMSMDFMEVKNYLKISKVFNSFLDK